MARRSLTVLTLLVLIARAACLAGTVAPPETVALGPGAAYMHEQHEDVPWSIHIVKIDLSQSDLRLTASLGDGAVLVRQTVSSQVAAFDPALGEPLAAVNGDYFEIKNEQYFGCLQGLHIAQGELISGPFNNTFWVDGKGRPHIGDVAPSFTVTWPDGSTMPFHLNGEPAEVKSEVGSADAMLYTPAFGPSTLRKGAVEFVLEPARQGDWPPLHINRKCAARVKAVNAEGDSPIGPRTMILSVSRAAAEKLPRFKAGAMIALSTAASADLSDAATAMGGGPILLSQGQITPAAAGTARHPRTAIGFNREHVFLVVVDGRQPALSVGMGHRELAALMLRLGCTEALNLDGGGSSTMWVAGKIVNSPSDGAERPVGNGLILFRKKGS